MADIKELIRKSVDGDTEAFGEIVAIYQDMAVGYAYSILGDFHYAQDAAQEAFIQAYLNIKKLNELNAFNSWLRKIVFSSCNRIIRKRKFNTINLDIIEKVPDYEHDTLNEFERIYTRNQVLSTLKSLPKEQRSLIILYYINNYSYKEIASFLNLPVTTINNRLHSAKQKIKKEMFYMFEENIQSIRVSGNNEFKKQVLKGISRIGFQPNENMAPENIPFPSVMRACLENIGENYGFEIIEEANLKVSKAYTFLMGVSGSTFRFFWNWNSRTSEGGRIDSLFFINNPIEQIDISFEACGYNYELLFNKNYSGKVSIGKEYFKDKSYIKKKIVESIRDKKKPVIGLGIVGPTEWSIVTGYDEDGEVLIGWSYFQDSSNKDLDFEPCGYFRKRDWFDDTSAIIIIGEKKVKPSLDYIYNKVLMSGIKQMDKGNINNTPIGFDGYIAWSDDLLNDEYFPRDEERILKNRYAVQEVTCLELAERRWYGAKFFEYIIKDFPVMKKDLMVAAKCFQEEHNMMWQILELTGGFMNQEAYIKFAEPNVRKRISEIILKALEKDMEAAKYILEALNKLHLK